MPLVWLKCSCCISRGDFDVNEVTRPLLTMTAFPKPAYRQDQKRISHYLVYTGGESILQIFRRDSAVFFGPLEKVTTKLALGGPCHQGRLKRKLFLGPWGLLEQ